jgi:hypothetical protein
MFRNMVQKNVLTTEVYHSEIRENSLNLAKRFKKVGHLQAQEDLHGKGP